MPQKTIGPTFAAELAAAGLVGLPFAWSAAGDFEFGEDMTPMQIAGVQAVYAAHDPVHAALVVLRQQKIVAIDAVAETRAAAGLSYGGKVIQIDDASRQNISGIATRALGVVQGVEGLTWPVGFAWRCLDNSWLEISAADFLAMAQQAADLYTAIVVHRAALKDAATAAADQAALDAIDLAAGWPA